MLGLRQKIDKFWPGYIDEFKDDMAKEIVETNKLDNSELIMAALAEIMEEQKRMARTVVGWPTRRHEAIRFALFERAKLL